MVLLTSLNYADPYEWLLTGSELQTKKGMDTYQLVMADDLQSLREFLGKIRKVSFNFVTGTALIWVATGHVAQWRVFGLVTDGTRFEFLCGYLFSVSPQVYS